MPGSCKFLFSGLAFILTQLVAIPMRSRCPAHRILEFIILMRYGELSLYSQMNHICNVPCIRDCTMYIWTLLHMHVHCFLWSCLSHAAAYYIIDTMMIMSMRWDHVSELLPPTRLLFIPKMICEHGEPWRNHINRGNLLIRPPELSGNTNGSHLVAKQNYLAKEMMNLALRSILFILRRAS
jgi:hypothetical protein